MKSTLPALLLAAFVLLVLAVASLFVGVSNVSLSSLMSGDAKSLQVLFVSRAPRTAALILAGSSMAIVGMIMQMLARNRFVEPSTIGTAESASLGILAVTVLAPDAPVIVKMITAALFAMAGTALFLRILKFVPLRSVLLVPLVGIMLAGVIGAITNFFAYRLDLLQSLGAWMTGDFSVVLKSRYELLWVAGALGLAAYVAADRFTVAGLGQDFTTNLGLNYRRVMLLGLTIVSLVTASVIVTVGSVPFLGLIVPNVVAMTVGDNMRRSLPWVAILGAGFVLVCDIFGRLIIRPYEMPIGAVMGVIGAFFFLYLLLRRTSRAA